MSAKSKNPNKTRRILESKKYLKKIIIAFKVDVLKSLSGIRKNIIHKKYVWIGRKIMDYKSLKYQAQPNHWIRKCSLLEKMIFFFERNNNLTIACNDWSSFWYSAWQQLGFQTFSRGKNPFSLLTISSYHLPKLPYQNCSLTQVKAY